MSHKKIELCVHIPGPKTIEQPLEKMEQFALRKHSIHILNALEEGVITRIIDYTGNYFLIFPEETKESV